MRIITGSARGSRLKVPAGKGTRPTADRTREALFSMLSLQAPVHFPLKRFHAEHGMLF